MSVDQHALTRSLAELAASVPAPATTLSHQLGVVVGAAAELLGVDCVGVLLLDDRDQVRTVAASGPAAAALELVQEQLQLGPGIDVLTTGQVLTVVDLAVEPGYRQLWSELAGAGVRGVLSAPVVVRAEIVGNLNLVTVQRHEWSAAERRAAAAFGDLIGQLLRAATSAVHPGGPIGGGGAATPDADPERETEEPGP